MELGRGFLAGEDQPEAPQAVTVLSNAFWLEHFGTDPQIIDKQIRMEGRAFTIVGVAARLHTGSEPVASPSRNPRPVAQTSWASGLQEFRRLPRKRNWRN
jgi:hypothetical protein